MTSDWLAPDMRRIRAPNPSAMTGTGTNTYILGRGGVVVIDPGPDIPQHQAAILATLEPQETVLAILVTHAHQDHCGLAPALSKAVNAPTYGFGPAHSGRSAVMRHLVDHGLKGGGEGFDHVFVPDHPLQDGQALHFGPLTVQTHHTPGHTGCHLCFVHEGRLFSGDHVMGWSTSLVSPPDGDMAEYLNSLDLLASLGCQIAYPGHGEPISDLAARISALAAHRAQREAAVLAALGPDPEDLSGLTRKLYADTPPHLWPAAERNLLALLIKLWNENRISADRPPSDLAKFHAKL